VRLTVFNALGQEVGQLVNDDKDAGYHEVKFNGSGLSSGVYLYRMQARDFVQTRKLLLVR
ncbi:MAG TPA: T9SS type A sorting domain-containing protein, partial [Bacteroidota bacterium]|nr:T9SS type A sorting domain-containing protein [Bacteroidota bacterium]